MGSEGLAGQNAVEDNSWGLAEKLVAFSSHARILRMADQLSQCAAKEYYC